MCENRVSIGPKGEEVTVRGRELQTEELHNLCSSTNVKEDGVNGTCSIHCYQKNEKEETTSSHTCRMVVAATSRW
jgi:hypothetical protein